MNTKFRCHTVLHIVVRIVNRSVEVMQFISVRCVAVHLTTDTEMEMFGDVLAAQRMTYQNNIRRKTFPMM